jgi:YVTN family beta-propeller protein
MNPNPRATEIRTAIALGILSSVMYPTASLAAPFAYVPNTYSSNLSVIDVATEGVVATVPLGNRPAAVAATPSGRRVYVVADDPGGQIWIVDTTTHSIVDTLELQDQLRAIAIAPDGRAYIAGVGGIYIINTRNNTDAGTVDRRNISRIVISPDGARAYATDDFVDGVWEIDTTSNSAVLLDTFRYECRLSSRPDCSDLFVPCFCVDDSDCPGGVCRAQRVFTQPLGMAVGSNGGSLYVSDNARNTFKIIDLASKACQAGDNEGGSCTVDTDCGDAGSMPECGSKGYCPCIQRFQELELSDVKSDVAISADGVRAFAAGPGGLVSILDTATNTLSDEIAIDEAGHLFAVALSPDGARLYATDVSTNAVWAVDVAARSAVRISVGSFPRDITIASPSAAPFCPGDCDSDGFARVGELLTLVGIALDDISLSACPTADLDGNGRVTVNEVVTGLNNVLAGCP